jgi:hypothetical protein
VRTVPLVLVIAGAGALYSLASKAQTDPTAASVRFDCSAFRNNMNGTWTTTKDTAVYGGFDEDSGKRDLAAGITFTPDMFRPMSADIVVLLDRRCGPRG